MSDSWTDAQSQWYHDNNRLKDDKYEDEKAYEDQVKLEDEILKGNHPGYGKARDKFEPYKCENGRYAGYHYKRNEPLCEDCKDVAESNAQAAFTDSEYYGRMNYLRDMGRD